MFSQFLDTVKRTAKAFAGAVSSYTLRSCRAIGRAMRFLSRCTGLGIKAAGRFLAECFRAFGKSVRGCGRLIRQFFVAARQNGIKAAFQAQHAAFKQIRSRHARVLSRGAVVAVPLMVMLLVGITAPVWANFTIAKRVVYAQNVLGDILDAKTYETAKDYFISSVEGGNGAAYLEDYSLNTVYVMKKQVLSAQMLAKQMLNNTKGLVGGYGLYVDEQLALVSETSAPFYAQLYAMLGKYKTSASAESAFVQAVEVREGFFPADTCVDDTEVENAFAQNTLQLSVKTTVIEEYDETVAYSVKKTDSNKLTAGKTKVVTKGQNGTNRITARVTYVNGAEVERIITDTQVVAEPVAQQVLVGTKRSVSKRAATTSSKVMLWPIDASAKYRITSPFNEDRSSHYHQGIDIACDKGTPIYAAMAGTVSVAKNSGSYGKHIMINHGNNVVTVYAHCSALYVSVGDKVAKGEQIAAVGSTGRSTGNHLHFEVRINGKQYNPMYYVAK